MRASLESVRKGRTEPEEYGRSLKEIYVFSFRPEGYEDTFRVSFEVPRRDIDTESEPINLHPFEAAFTREQTAFFEVLPQLLRRAPGKFAAFRNGRLVDEDADEFALAARIEQAYRGEFVLIRRIAAACPEDCLDSPESESP